MHLFKLYVRCCTPPPPAILPCLAICEANFSQAFLHIMLFLSKSFCLKVFSFYYMSTTVPGFPGCRLRDM